MPQVLRVGQRLRLEQHLRHRHSHREHATEGYRRLPHLLRDLRRSSGLLVEVLPQQQERCQSMRRCRLLRRSTADVGIERCPVQHGYAVRRGSTLLGRPLVHTKNLHDGSDLRLDRRLPKSLCLDHDVDHVILPTRLRDERGLLGISKDRVPQHHRHRPLLHADRPRLPVREHGRMRPADGLRGSARRLVHPTFVHDRRRMRIPQDRGAQPVQDEQRRHQDLLPRLHDGQRLHGVHGHGLQHRRSLLDVKPALATLLSVCLLACVEAHEGQPTAAENSTVRTSDAQQSMHSLRTKLSRSSEGLVVERDADGVKKVNLQGRFASASVMTAERRAICVDSPAALDRIAGTDR
jgi:hypothetical protein